MSQCYQVTLKESVVRVVKGKDSVSYPIELTQILPPEEMVELLRAELKEQGWEAENEEETIFVTEGSGGETLRIDLEAMELTAELVSERIVEAQASATGASADDSLNAKDNNRLAASDARKRLQDESAMIGDKIEGEGTKEIQEEVSDKLAESEGDRQLKMNEILQKVYAESLKRKAHQLGDVMDIQEGTGEDGNYELTIRIEQ